MLDHSKSNFSSDLRRTGLLYEFLSILALNPLESDQQVDSEYMYINQAIEYIKNNSRNALLSNLREYFMQHGKFSWNDKAALFYGFVSEDALKSYFRAENYKTPPLSKLDEMAEALGKPTYELIKEVEPNEKTNT